MENVTDKRVVITGMGLLTPLGNTLEQFWRNSLQGKVGYDRLQGYEHMALKKPCYRQNTAVRAFGPDGR
ncbi:beta-ketoacyl synthase N-terminal-like domain-containing protein [Paenibacillus rhizoplanae]